MRRSSWIAGFAIGTLFLASPSTSQNDPGAANTTISVENNGKAEVVAQPQGGAPGQAPAAAQPEAASQPASAELKTAEEVYDVKVRDIEEKVNELKEKIFRSKARLLALQEAVLGGVSSGARAVLVHRNEMGSTFRLREMHYFIDGAPLRQEVDEQGDTLASKEEIELFSGNIVPGNHQVTVNLVYQGHGYGVFSYLNGYTFRIKSSYTFKAEEGKETKIKIVAFEKGGFTAELKDRPAIRYDVEIARYVKKKDAAQAGQTTTPPAAPQQPTN